MNDYVMAYGDDGEERIETQAQLDALLDRVAALPRPTWAELVSADERSVFQIGLGRSEFSSLLFYDRNPGGRMYRSTVTLDEPKDADFDYGGVPTTMDSGSAITVEEARGAASEFLVTGRRPEIVAWEIAE